MINDVQINDEGLERPFSFFKNNLCQFAIIHLHIIHH